MGRLTLNVLLSFAQFEREVTGERIRDKIAASKKKGIWMGGSVPLGYRVENRKLLIDETESATVRTIFERYLALGSLVPLIRELRERDIRTRVRTLSSGGTVGGVHLTKGPLAGMLRNRTYIGELNHRDTSYPGEHQAIIDRDVFDAVQAKLAENKNHTTAARIASNSLLMGKVFDDAGNRMTPTWSQKKGLRYRYYVSRCLIEGHRQKAGSVSRISAEQVETKVIAALRLRPGNQPASPDPDSTNDDKIPDRSHTGAAYRRQGPFGHQTHRRHTKARRTRNSPHSVGPKARSAKTGSDRANGWR